MTAIAFNDSILNILNYGVIAVKFLYKQTLVL